ncbi:hypothetical protein KVP08_004775 [Shewanella putrefaciens]|nr:hypothetical protein KVP08_004775 [Shewanella putrefaciens]
MGIGNGEINLILNYDGWCRRIDLHFRSQFPHINTRLFKLDDYMYELYLVDSVDDFDYIDDVFSKEIKFLTAPIKLVENLPQIYKIEIERITDDKIPSKFEGYPLTINQIYSHILSIHPNVKLSGIKEDHDNRTINVELTGNYDTAIIGAVEETVNSLKGPYAYKVFDGGELAPSFRVTDEIFNIAPSQAKKELNCPFIERDETLWFENIENIYNGSYQKSELYFFVPSKTACLVNFSKFQNANLRNHLLLYDVVYCVLPLAQEMSNFLTNQKISRDEILHLVKRGRLKILNMQPESRLDYGFINEAFQENPSSVVSRRALSALCAIDLVDLNRSYILSDPELDKYIYPLMREISELTGKDIRTISNFLLWPKKALRRSLDSLNQAGPMGASRYGVNNPIIDSLPAENKENIEFEFIVNSDQIHLSHALDATYFPFFIDGDKYSDHPYALMMGEMLNFFKNSSYQNIFNLIGVENIKSTQNPSIGLISTFDINDYIPVLEFEEEISSSVIRHGMNSLFSELNFLGSEERSQRISQYNLDVNKALRYKNVSNHALDLGEDALGMFIPFFATGKKLIKGGTKMAMDKFPAIQNLSEFIEAKSSRESDESRNITILTKVNRVAKLKREFK